MFNTILVSSKNSSGENEYDFLNITSFLALLKGKKMMFSLCDITGKMAMPWVEAGYIAVLVDPQHEKYAPQHSKIWFDGNYLRISCFLIDCISFLGQLSKHNQVVFVSGFPPCTDVAVSGAAHFAKKAAKDKHFQSKAALIAEQCRTIGLMTGAPYFFENPVSVFSSIFGAPQYTFHPYYYTAYCKEDNYTKKTCLWTGNGFKMPEPQMDNTLSAPDDRIHKAPPGPDRANFRSATPMGFAKAVFNANHPKS